MFVINLFTSAVTSLADIYGEMMTLIKRVFLCLFLFAGNGSEAAAVELKMTDILDSNGNGTDRKGNSSDDTWQFWFELAHARGTFRPFTIHTSTMSSGQRKNGIPRKVRGPIAGLLPNPANTNGWILHRDWDGRFEGIWGDQKAKQTLAHPYVEKNVHCAVAITYKVPTTRKYDVSCKLTDVQVAPKFPKHDGILIRLEKTKDAGNGTLLAQSGPIGDGHGRPDFGTCALNGVFLKQGERLRLVVHPNKWWGQDLTRIDEFRIE